MDSDSSAAKKLYNEFLAISIQSELQLQLSESAGVFLPGSKEFEESNLRYTQYSRPTYLVAIRAANETDVAIAVKYAQLRSIPCAARGGGHCVTSSMKALQNGLVIDMRGLNKLSYNPEKDHVTVGGGIQSGPFIEFLHGLNREATVGSCPTTGLLGVCLGGGIGRLQGKYGYLSDNLISCRIVLADGSCIMASETEHKELFWALRGAGHNFGIVVEATFRVYPQAHGGIHHSWDLEFSLRQGRDIFQLMNTLIPDMDPNLSIFILYLKTAASGAQDVILINIVWSGIKEEGNHYVSKFLELSPIAPVTQVSAEWPKLPWITYQGLNAKLLGNSDVWNVLPCKIFSAVSLKNFDVESMHEWFLSLKEESDRGHYGAFTMIEAFSHRRVKEISDEATAFPWRNGCDVFLMSQTMAKTFEHEDEACQWLNTWKKKLVEASGYGRLQQYANYGHGSNVDDPVEALYGYDGWRLEKLRQLKKEYDPKNYWRWYQPFAA